jgi:hypothetical protein
VVGTDGTSAYRWDRTNGLLNLGSVPGSTDVEANVINGSGCIVGSAYIGSIDHLLYWGPSGGVQDISVAAGLNPSDRVEGGALNNHGQVVLNWTTADWSLERPCVWSAAGGLRMLDTFPGSVSAWGGNMVSGINDNGYMVGQVFASGKDRAVCWNSDGHVTDLNLLVDSSGAGWTLDYATSINDLGQIIGGGTYNGDPTRAFLLTPTPEPAAALGLAVMGLLLCVRRAR